MPKSEILFEYGSESRGHWGDLCLYTVQILSDFEGIGWPYQVKIRRLQYAAFAEAGDEPEETVETHRISAACFASIKAAIASHTELLTCPDRIENSVYDGVAQRFYFACDTFSKSVSGASVLGCAHIEESMPVHQRRGNYKVADAYYAVQALLEAQGIQVL